MKKYIIPTRALQVIRGSLLECNLTWHASFLIRRLYVHASERKGEEPSNENNFGACVHLRCYHILLENCSWRWKSTIFESNYSPCWIKQKKKKKKKKKRNRDPKKVVSHKCMTVNICLRSLIMQHLQSFVRTRIAKRGYKIWIMVSLILHSYF